jgi:hypothetical protein
MNNFSIETVFDWFSGITRQSLVRGQCSIIFKKLYETKGKLYFLPVFPLCRGNAKNDGVGVSLISAKPWLRH